jgi:hypothetical protein
MTTQSVVEAYLDGWRRKDSADIEILLGETVSFKGPMLVTEGREAFMIAVNAVLPIIKDIVLHDVFVDGSHAVAIYDSICIDLIGVCRTAELISVKNDLIDSSEIFLDARPFETAMA